LQQLPKIYQFRYLVFKSSINILFSHIDETELLGLLAFVKNIKVINQLRLFFTSRSETKRLWTREIYFIKKIIEFFE